MVSMLTLHGDTSAHRFPALCRVPWNLNCALWFEHGIESLVEYASRKPLDDQLPVLVSWIQGSARDQLGFAPQAISAERCEQHYLNIEDKLTRPYSSRSTCSGSLRLNRLSSTRLGSSCFISSSTRWTAFSRPSFVVLVIWRYNGGL